MNIYEVIVWGLAGIAIGVLLVDGYIEDALVWIVRQWTGRGRR